MIEIDLAPILGGMALRAQPGIVPGGRFVAGLAVEISTVIEGGAGPLLCAVAARALTLVVT